MHWGENVFFFLRWRPHCDFKKRNINKSAVQWHFGAACCAYDYIVSWRKTIILYVHHMVVRTSVMTWNIIYTRMVIRLTKLLTKLWFCRKTIKFIDYLVGIRQIRYKLWTLMLFNSILYLATLSFWFQKLLSGVPNSNAVIFL